MSAVSWRNLAAVALLALALLQMAGDLTGSRVLKGFGAMSVASPCPKVFCDSDGLEPFASRFELRAQVDGETRVWLPTPELYARIRGPYNRRNAYGAALAYAPRLPGPLRAAVYHHAFCGEAPLKRELGLPENARDIAVHITTRTRGRDDSWIFPACAH